MKLTTISDTSNSAAPMDTKRAAEYLGVKKETVAYHLYVACDLQPSFYIGRSPAFTKENLDNFITNKRSPGRPKSEVSHPVA